MAVDSNIIDVKYGDSYDPLILRVYKGDELIYERNSWDFVLENVDFDGKESSRVKTDINPFSSQNINRNWEILLNAETVATTESRTDIGIFSVTNGRPTPHYNLELGVCPGRTYIDVHGAINGPETAPYITSSGKDVHVIKQGSTLTISVEQELIWTGTLTDMTGGDAQRLHVGGCTMGSTYHFLGHLNYFKFRYTS